MAGRKKPAEPPKKAVINEQPITDTLEQNYMPYAMSVIVSRAIPEIDGFKPSHRKLLYTMYKMGLLTGDRTKSTNVVGQTMKLNPHGDAAIYETLVRLTEGNGALMAPFVDSKGNFGKQYSRDMAYAAARYTEVKLAPICGEVFADIDKNTVEFMDNYDATMKEPRLLPTTFPNILVNPNQGIAVGMASSFCGFNLREVCEAAMGFIKGRPGWIAELRAPDFPTGGALILNEKELQNIYETGRGSVRVRAKYRYDKKESLIEVYEIPYSTNIETIIDKIAGLVKAGKIKDITDVRDETDLNGLKIAIDIRKSADPDMVMHRLFSLTPLSDSISCNFNLLIDGRPKTLGVAGILEEWTRFRVNSVKGRLAYDIARKEEKLHLLEGLAKILADIDRAIAIIRHTEKEADVVPNLMAGFLIDEAQAEFIAEIKLRNINKEYILNRISEVETLREDIEKLKSTLESEAKIRDVICAELKSVAKKYGKDRKTEIILEEHAPTVSHEELIEDYGIKLFLTRQNYFKKISLVSMRSSGAQKLKEDDEIAAEIETGNKADILFFSDKRNMYKLKAYDAPDGKAGSLGDYLNNLLGLPEDEHILFMAATYDYSGLLIFAYDNGKAAKIALSAYAANRRKLINAYSPKGSLMGLVQTEGDLDLLLLRDRDKAVLFNTELLPLMTTKSSGGVTVYNLKKNSFVSALYRKDRFASEDIEYYRTKKIPTTGHFITEADREKNALPMQIKLF